MTRTRYFDHDAMRARRAEGVSLRDIAAEFGCSKALVGQVVAYEPARCHGCQAVVPDRRTKCDSCLEKNLEEGRRRSAEVARAAYVPHPAPPAELPKRIVIALLAHPDWSYQKVADDLGCSRIYCLKVAKKAGISRRAKAANA